MIEAHVLIAPRDLGAGVVASDQEHSDAVHAREAGDRLILARLKVLGELRVSAVSRCRHRDGTRRLILDFETPPAGVRASGDGD